MKKVISLLMTIIMMTGVFCVAAIPSSAADEKTVVAIDYIPVEPITLIEKYGGYESGDDYIYNTPSFKSGDRFIVYYDTGESKEYVAENIYEYDYNDIVFVDGNGNRIDERPYLSSYSQYSTPWTLGSDNYVTVRYKNVSSEVPVTIVENPVESIEFEFATPVVLYDKRGGYYDIDVDGTEYRLFEDESGYFYEVWNEETEKNEKNYVDISSDNVFFFYSTMPLYKEGNKLTVHYKDGTSEILTHHFFFDEEHQGFYLINSDGEISQDSLRFDWTITVDTKFTLGSDNYIDVKYLGKTVQAPVTVVEDDAVDHIKYTPVSPITFNVDDEKDCRIGYFDEDDRVFDTTHRICATGSTLDVYFKDGTSKQYTFYIKPLGRDKFEPVLGYTYYLIDETGSQINYGLFGWTVGDSKWEPDNTYDITIKYLDATTTVPVTITSNWVKENGKTYYYVDGKMVTSKLMTIDGKKYYFGKDGAMYTSKLISVSGKKYYVGKDGAAYTKKLISVNGKKYYMGADGVAYKSKLISVNGKKYYIGSDCVAYKNKLASVSGKKYYFGSDCVAVTSKLISVSGKKYYMGKDGVAYKSKLISVSGKKYYIGSDCVAYKSKFASLSGKKYYFGSDCVMYKSKAFSVSGVKWVADKNGVCKKK